MLFLAACSSGRNYSPVIGGENRSAESGRAAASGNRGVVVVGTADTLYSIARKNKVPLRSLIDVNGLEPPYRLTVGQRLRLPRAATYRVVKGDTVYKIARKTDVDMNALVSLNNLREPYLIRVGEELRLPRRNAGSREISGEPAVARIPASNLPEGLRILPPRRGLTVAQQSRYPRAIVSPSDLKPRPGRNTAASYQAVSQPATNQQFVANIPAGRFLWPVDGRVVSRFGAKKGGFHNDGVNILASAGTPVRAAADGTVVFIRPDMRGFGQIVLVRHNKGWTTAYAHNQAILVKKGQKVRAGQVIARVGKSGGVDRPQLHFEVRKGSRAVNPQKYLLPKGNAVSARPMTRRQAGF